MTRSVWNFLIVVFLSKITLKPNFIEICQELGTEAIQTRRYIVLKFFSSCFFVKQYAHTKFQRNWSRFRYKSHTNTKIPEDSRRRDPIRLKFFSCCFFVKHYAHTKFHRNRSRIRHKSHINTKIPEDSRRSGPIGLKFLSSYFFVKQYARTKFQRNWSRIKHSSHTKLRKFTKLAEV